MQTFRISLAALAVALATSAGADEPHKAPHPWKVGEMLEVEFKCTRAVTEQVNSEGEQAKSATKKEVLLSYIDRVDEVSAGRVVALTRHFKSAKLIEDGRDVGGLALEGRHVKLRRGRDDDSVQVEGRLRDQAVFVAEAGPWPDVDRTWATPLGSREGKLQAVSTYGWARPAGTPSFVAEVVNEFSLSAVTTGAWSMTVTGDLAPAGKVVGEVSLAGREADEEGYAVEVSDLYELTLTRAATKLEALPPETAPAPEADEDEGDLEAPMEGDEFPQDEDEDQ